MPSKLNRRTFIQNTLLTGAALSLPGLGSSADTSTQKSSSSPSAFRSKLRLGFIGVGLRGQDHVTEALQRDDCEIAAIADPDAGMVTACLKMIEEKGGELKKHDDNVINKYHIYNPEKFKSLTIARYNIYNEVKLRKLNKA